MEQLGIDGKLLVAQMVNFFIILFVLSKLLYKPILAALDKRREDIKKGLELTEQMEKEKQNLEITKDHALEKIKKESVQIIDEAKLRGKEAEKEIIAEARIEAGKIIEKAKEESKQMKLSMQKSIRDDAITLAEAMTKRLVSGILDEKMQRELLTKEVKKISSLHA
jgi:F-type H+-transporting ATPase subunit b